MCGYLLRFAASKFVMHIHVMVILFKPIKKLKPTIPNLLDCGLFRSSLISASI